MVIYVETCPKCSCALARSADGAPRPSPRLRPECDGCACHDEYPLAASS